MSDTPTPQPNALASVPPNQWHPKVGDWFILKGSYCGSGNERGCTDASPCADCLAMSNRFIIAGEHYGTFFFNPQFCTRGDGCRLDETCCSVLYTGDIVPKLLPKEGPATHISECLFLAPIAQPADAATAQESMDVLDQPERSFDTYAAKLQKLLKEARDIAAETLIESMKRAQEITALKDQLSTAEKKARELGAALARLQSDWNSGYEAGLQDAEKEQKGCQSEGDTHGLNFHQGRWHGLVAADLILQPLFKLLPPTPAQEQAGGAARVEEIKEPEVMFAVYAREPGTDNWFERETSTDESLVREWRDRNNQRSPELYDPPREYILVKRETTFIKLP